jgi:hypothetical protein
MAMATEAASPTARSWSIQGGRSLMVDGSRLATAGRWGANDPALAEVTDRGLPRHRPTDDRFQTRPTRSSSTWVNAYNIFDAALPFGGYEQLGRGVRWAGWSPTRTGKPNQSASDDQSGAGTTRMQ